MDLSPELAELSSLKAAFERHEVAEREIERAARQISSFAGQPVRKTELPSGEVDRLLSLPPAKPSNASNGTQVRLCVK